MRFLADMGVDVRIVRCFASRRTMQSTSGKKGCSARPNGEIFAKAVAEERVILTFDPDFGEIAALARGRRASVVLFRLHNTRTPHVIARLGAVLAECAGALQEGAVVIVEESRCRVRFLPVGETGDKP